MLLSRSDQPYNTENNTLLSFEDAQEKPVRKERRG